MVKLASTLSRLHPVKVLVIGDLMLDLYTIGKVRRISPEAPVGIVHVLKEEQKPGGAGNVMLNLASLGAQVVAIGRVGPDNAGESLLKVLKCESINTSYIFAQEGYRTPVKNRIIADNQQIVRVDHEEITALPELLEQKIIEALPASMKGIHVIAISDYGKGFLTPTLLSAIISCARKEGIRVIVDPKGHDFTKYHGAHLIKPNLSEAYGAAGLPHGASIDFAANKILQVTASEAVMITRSEEGISLFKKCGERTDFPVHAREIKDVTGAGDTVLAMLVYAVANNLSSVESVQLCNVAAGIAIEQLGCARVTLVDLAQRLLEMNSNNKVFDEDHLYALQKVLEVRPFQILTLSEEQASTSDLYRKIRDTASNGQGALLVYIANPTPTPSFIEMLAAFKEVDFILLHEKSLKDLCKSVSPTVYA